MNKNKNKLFIFIILILLIANTVFSSVLWFSINHHPQIRPNPPVPRGHYLLEELHPDSAQKIQLHAMMTTHFVRMDSLKEQEHSAKNAFFSLLLTDTASVTTILNYAEHASKIQFEIDTMLFNHFYKMRSMCNPEQKEKLDRLIQRILIKSDVAHSDDQPAPFERDNSKQHNDPEKSVEKDFDKSNDDREEMSPHPRSNHRMPQPPPPNDHHRRPPHEAHPNDFHDGPPDIPPSGMEK